ncbi:hypothetical protein OG756_06545 [Streptomyces sp. NBC_01310]|uniref:hypothetical protein n=1 Tax=Streptomyces sp. NBC_01310 TaxID=2903820 RepID=UPI0035B5DFFA|nr:hypothetical protein OG756_06545 [Streptomyces sp. NBC_01310]
MSTADLTPPEAARWAARSGLPLPNERHAPVAATADHIRSVVSVLRELDFGDTPPSAAYRAGGEQHDAAV